MAIAVGRAGVDARPPLPVPPSLRPFLKLQWLPPRALPPVRNALDADDEFRSRVAAAATEELLGRAGWLFLVRPDGWEDELAALAEATSVADSVEAESREERVAARKLAGAEAARARAEEAAAKARAAAVAAEERLAGERRARAALEATVTELEDKVAALRHERDDARARLDAALARAERAAPTPAAAPPPPPPVPPARPVPPEVVDSLAAAAGAASRLADQLGDALAALRPAASPAAVPAPAPPPRPRRAPVVLPLGVFDDGPEATAFLLRHPGVLLLVDGYNFTLSASPWSELDIAEQRRRLVDALGGLGARTGADIEVVFDGAEGEGTFVPTAGRRPVRVSFSPPDVEADDVIIARTAALPVERAVVVASSDRRVQDGARANGANVVSSAQLLAALR